jgi:hypothetical protein
MAALLLLSAIPDLLRVPGAVTMILAFCAISFAASMESSA